jgi:hypothetical protein
MWRSDGMTKARALMVGFALVTLLLVPGQAYAYLDPGTTSSLFAVLAPVIALFGVFLGYLLWPFRFVIVNVFLRKKADEAEPEAEDAPEAGAETQAEPEVE